MSDTSTATDSGTEVSVTDSADLGDDSQVTDTDGSIFSEGFTFVDGYADKLVGEEFNETRATLANYKSFPDVANALLESKRAATARLDGMVKLPGSESTPEEIAAYNAAIGVPDSPQAYEIAPPESLPEGVEFDEAFLEPFKEVAHSLGITNDQANKLIAWQAQQESAEYSQINERDEQASQRAQQDLQNEWGPQWEQKNMAARRAAATFGMDLESPLLKNPDVLRAMANAAGSLSEGKLISADQVSGNLSPGNESADIVSNPDNPLHAAYHDPTHPNHAEAVKVNLRKLEEQARRDGY